MKRVSSDHLIASYDENHKPCVEVELGEPFSIETHDRIPLFSLENKLSENFKDRFNPVYAVTGPVYVRGTTSGDILRIDILDIRIEEDGFICETPGRAGFGDKINNARIKRVKIKNDTILFSKNIRVPANPHIGKLATTPPGSPVPTGSPGPHGGNMDNKHLTTGSSLFLPVFLEGSLISLGDLHAAMGDGESNSSGVEATGVVTLSCHLEKGLNIRQPLLVTPSEVQMMGQGKTLEEAGKMALDHMANLAREALKIDYLDAAMLISIAGDLHVCQIANPLVGVRVSLSRELFAEMHWLPQ
jgi:amidase